MDVLFARSEAVDFCLEQFHLVKYILIVLHYTKKTILINKQK